MMMESRRILPSCLTAELAIELAHGEGRKGSKAYPYTITARQFAKHLIDLGVVLVPSPTPQQIVRKELQHSFEDYLHRHRGLSQQTISQNWSFADRFLDHRFGDTDIDLAAISAGDVIAFLQMTISKKVPSRTNTATSAATYLRNFLRYLFKRGLTASNLALCVPRVTKRYNARLPRYLSPDQVETVLAAVRANPTHGRRNHAMLLLQARLGLRAPEVMAIQLGDIDWRAGELTVRGKGQRHDRMPIPPDVGEALTAYIRHDRVSTSRALFVTLRAPYGPFKSGHMLNNFLKKAFAATGVKPPRPYVGSHVLRHSLATNMVRNGASLAEVGDMLRHRSCATTMIYAKLDIDGLRSIAQSWPAVGGVQ
jgi:site-specific recombinase XerD